MVTPSYSPKYLWRCPQKLWRCSVLRKIGLCVLDGHCSVRWRRDVTFLLLWRSRHTRFKLQYRPLAVHNMYLHFMSQNRRYTHHERQVTSYFPPLFLKIAQGALINSHHVWIKGSLWGCPTPSAFNLNSIGNYHKCFYLLALGKTILGRKKIFNYTERMESLTDISSIILDGGGCWPGYLTISYCSGPLKVWWFYSAHINPICQFTVLCFTWKLGQLTNNWWTLWTRVCIFTLLTETGHGISTLRNPH